MNLETLQEKRRKLTNELEVTLASDNFSKKDNERCDLIFDQIGNLDRQIRTLQEDEKADELEAKRALSGGSPEAEVWRNHKGTNTAEVYSRGVTIHVPKPENNFTLGRFLRCAYAGGSNEAERRALAESSDGSGGVTVPEYVFAEFLDRLRAQNRVMQAGAKTVSLESNSNTIAKLATDATLEWRAENIAINASDPTFSGVTFEPKTVGALTRVSMELLQDSLNIEDMLATMFVNSFANEVDRVALVGDSGDGEPDGVLNFSDLSLAYSMGTDGSSFVDGPATGATSTGNSPFYPFLAVISAIKQNNVSPSAAIMAPRTLVDLYDLVATDNQPLQMPKIVSDMMLLDTSGVPVTDTIGANSDGSKIFIGDWSKLLIGIRKELTLQVLKERYAENLQTGFLGAMRFDIQAEHEKAFGYIAGVRSYDGSAT